MDANAQPSAIQTAVFVPICNSLLHTRKAVKQAILHGQSPARFAIHEEIHYYTGILDRILFDRRELLHLSENTLKHLPSEEGQPLSCVALLDLDSYDGVAVCMIHGRLYATYLPIMTSEQAETEAALINGLRELSKTAKHIPLQLDDHIKSGRYTLSGILTYLLKQV